MKRSRPVDTVNVTSFKKRKVEPASGFDKAVDWLLSWILSPEALLSFAAKSGLRFTVNELIAKNVKLKATDAEQAVVELRLAIERNNLRIAETLFTALGDNRESLYNDMTPLHHAIQCGKTDIAQMLLNAGANIKALYEDMTPLHHAIQKNQPEVVQALLMLGANKEALYDGMTPLHSAIQEKHIKIVQVLLTAKVNKNALYKRMRPLHCAIAENQPEIVRLLLAEGANKEAIYLQKTPLHWAIEARNYEIIQVLLTANANREALYQDMTPLHYAIKKGQAKIAEVLLTAGANKEALYEGRTPLHHAIKNEEFLIIRNLINVGADKEALFQGLTPLSFAIRDRLNIIAEMLINTGASKEVPFNVLKSATNAKLIEALLPHCLIEGLPLHKLLSNSRYFNSNKRRKAFLKSARPVRFLRSKKLLSPVTLAALELLVKAREVQEYEASLALDDENAMSDSKVVRANWHFENIVKPHFNSAMRSLIVSEKCQDALSSMEPILAIEKQIRELLVNTILKQAQVDNEQNVITFINENKGKLIEADSTAMQASCSVFTKANAPQAAWRGYNPYAPVSGEWPNLLTPPDNNELVFTTGAAHQGELLAQAASDILRKRVAYYYLAVIDKNDGDDNTRAIRIENFIGQLADIRNAHGPNNPSCYPGSLTRCADMGAFHAVAQLPPATKEMIADYIKVKTLAVFQAEMEALTTFTEKEALYQALVELTTVQAKEVILFPERYQADWLTKRDGFINKMGTKEEIIQQIFVSDLFPITEGDSIFVEQALMDIAGGTTNAVLADYFNRHTDSVPTLEDKQNANPFKDIDSSEYKLTDILINTILQVIPVYATSMRRLNNLSAYLANKVPKLVGNEPLKNLLAGLEIADEHFEEVLQKITSALENSGWKALVHIVNPFDGMIKQMELLIKNVRPENAIPHGRQLKALKQKQQYFNDYLPIVQQVFQDTDIQNECIARLTQALASHLATSDEGYDQAELLSFLSDEDKQFVQGYSKQLEDLTKHFHQDVNRQICLNRM